MKTRRLGALLSLFVILFSQISIVGGAGPDGPAASRPNRRHPFAPALGTASGTFVPSGQTLGDNASEVALGDLDGDGDLDVFSTHYGPSQTWFNLGAHSGQFSFGQSYGPTATLGLGVALGDLDGDSDLDAFVIEDQFTGNQIWLNQGGDQAGTPGSFGPNGQDNGEDLSSAVALGDLDGDDDLDAFVVRNVGRPDRVWVNNGSGQFSNSGQALGDGSGSDVALGDVDGDADLDALVADANVTRVWVNQGGAQSGTPGVFTSTQAISATFAIGVALGDVDGDGDLDAVVADNNAASRLLINQGGNQAGTEGVFATGQALSANNARDAALVDVDVDGDLDVFLARTGPDEVWINQGGVQGGPLGQFADSGQALGSAFTDSVALGDVDDDNDPDAFTADFSQPTQLWLNDGLSGLQTIYLVRDEVLDPSAQGQHYINLFYLHSPEITTLMLGDADLRAAGYDTLMLWLPNLASLVDREPDSATITEGQVDAMDSFLNDLAEAGSPNLKEALLVERNALPPLDDFVGMTIAAAKAVVLGPYTTYVPLVANGPARMQAQLDQPAAAPPTSGHAPRLAPPAVTTGGIGCAVQCVILHHCSLGR